MSLSGEPIVILGSYRSGTSSVSTALVNMGLYMGEESALFPADSYNPDGHWELKDMMAAHERILGAFRTNYHPTLWLPETWSDFPFSANIVNDLRGLLTKHFDGKAQWGWKEPATSILLPLYKEALGGLNARYLICVRHPKSVIASMRKRFVSAATASWSEDASNQPGLEERLMCMWVSYTLSSLKETNGTNRELICYERYLQTPRIYMERIADFLPWKPTPAQIDAATETVKPQLSHSTFKPAEGFENWPTIVERTYQLCLKADEESAAFRAGEFDQQIDDLWTEWIRWRNMMQSPTLPPSQMLFSWEGGEHIHKYSPTGTWQTISTTFQPPAGATIHIDPYHAPCRVWIRKVSNGGTPAELHAGRGGQLDEMGNVKRLSIFGPRALEMRNVSGGEFEIEILVQSNEAVMAGIVSALAKKL